MATETLVIPEEYLEQVIDVITTGLQYSIVDGEVRNQLSKWCDDHLRYIKDNEE